jgi:hypothetical protein
MRASTLGRCTKLLVILTAVILLAGIASAQVQGAAFTSEPVVSTPCNPNTCVPDLNSGAVFTVNGNRCSSGGTCNLMLRAQMLATALDVYFSTPGLGGNQIGAYNGLGTKTPALGGIAVDLSHICNMIDGTSGSSCSGTYEDSRPEFGIVTPCLGTTVGQMLSYSNFLSSVNGSPVATATTGANWYLQNKTKQVFAKDGFDNFNNQIVNIAPTSCGPTF